MLAEYQSIVSPLLGVADIVTVPASHLDAFPAVGKAGKALTVAVIGVLEEETHEVVVFLDST